MNSKAARAAMPRWITSSSSTAPTALQKLEILVNGEPVDALAAIVHEQGCLPLKASASYQAKRN